MLGGGRARRATTSRARVIWGKPTGNSINSVRGKLVSLQLWKLTPFELLMFVYYGPLFLVIGILNAGLTVSPKVPAWVSAALGVVLWVPQALHLFVAGIISLALRVIAMPVVGLSL